ncbi:hypothetical protein ISS07_00915 [Candidatus Woesearchaeota archaeon]|nr:hypothetical protein [Candidatus Woesearchaeota archaeon]
MGGNITISVNPVYGPLKDRPHNSHSRYFKAEFSTPLTGNDGDPTKWVEMPNASGLVQKVSKLLEAHPSWNPERVIIDDTIPERHYLDFGSLDRYVKQ